MMYITRIVLCQKYITTYKRIYLFEINKFLYIRGAYYLKF